MLHTAATIQVRSPERLNATRPIATWLPNGLAWILVDLASQWMGWVHVALDKRLSAELARRLLEHSQARLLVVETNDQVVTSASTRVVQRSRRKSCCRHTGCSK